VAPAGELIVHPSFTPGRRIHGAGAGHLLLGQAFEARPQSGHRPLQHSGGPGAEVERGQGGGGREVDAQHVAQHEEARRVLRRQPALGDQRTEKALDHMELLAGLNDIGVRGLSEEPLRLTQLSGRGSQGR